MSGNGEMFVIGSADVFIPFLSHLTRKSEPLMHFLKVNYLVSDDFPQYALIVMATASALVGWPYAGRDV